MVWLSAWLSYTCWLYPGVEAAKEIKQMSGIGRYFRELKLNPMKFLPLSLLLVLQTLLLPAQSGHKIEARIDGYEEDELYLAVYYGNKQYLQDTAYRNDQGAFVFEDAEPLEGGMYLIVLKPDNANFQLLVTEKEQSFSFRTHKDRPFEDMSFSNAPDNTQFYKYLSFLAQQRQKSEAVKEEWSLKDTDELQKRLEAIDAEVVAFQQDMVEKYPDFLSAAIVKANIAVKMPDFPGTNEELETKRWRYQLEHFFDNLDIGDPRMLRTPFLFGRIDAYVNQLQVRHPDTLAKAIDYVLEAAKPAEETFKFYLIHFLNEYARSNIVGMDAVYVHLVEKYYAKGLAPWTDPDQLTKIMENAAKLKPLLIGKQAPDIEMEKQDGTKISLYDVDAEYTILYFWRYDCGHCKESTPFMKEFYESFKDRGVAIFAICVKYTDEVGPCWDYVEEQEIGDWMHAVDPYNRSRYGQLYDVRSTPTLYILDRNKEIVSKRIGAEQLGEVMEQVIQFHKPKE